MPGEQLSLSKSSLAYAKLTATPTDSAWSQVYNAGNLFACLSLTLKEPSEEHTPLQNLGKELFNNLEAEFFTLEEKTIETIREAVHKSIKHLPTNVTANFCLAYFKDQTLYLFLLGDGRVIMKRGEKLGILLEKKSSTETPHTLTDSQQILTVSGYLTNGDTIILETNQFAKNISDSNISDALQLELPNDIAESLSIHMHKHTDGDQAAIIISYHGITQTTPLPNKEPPLEDDTDDENEPLAQTYSHTNEKTSSEPPLFSKFSDIISRIRLPFLRHNRRIVMGGLTHRKKFFLSITVIILALLIVSVVFTKQNQENTKTTALFESIYTPALKNYDEGKAIVSLNEDLSREDFLEAEKLLLEGRNKFPKDSKEAKQIEELLAKIQSELGGNETETSTAQTNVKEVTVDEANILSLEKANPDGRGFNQNNNSVYYVTLDEAIAIAKSTEKKTTLVENDNDWKQAVAIVPYQTNFYILDAQNGILKYVPTGSSLSKSEYLKSTQDLTKAVSMAIDSSIWVLFSDGNIKKYTRGEPDSFVIKGLTKPLKSPTKIYTNADIDNVYILDNGNSRIVKITTDGTFQAEYNAGIIKNAKAFEVLETDKKIHILSGDKIWELTM